LLFLSLLRPTTPLSVLSSLSLHDALPIWTTYFPGPTFAACLLPSTHEIDRVLVAVVLRIVRCGKAGDDRLIPHLRFARRHTHIPDRKSTRLNSSHGSISYAVFCLKKKTPS